MHFLIKNTLNFSLKQVSIRKNNFLTISEGNFGEKICKKRSDLLIFGYFLRFLTENRDFFRVFFTSVDKKNSLRYTANTFFYKARRFSDFVWHLSPFQGSGGVKTT